MPRSSAAFFLLPRHSASAWRMAVRSTSSRVCTPLRGNARELGLLQRGGQLYFRGELFHVDQALPRQHDGVFNCVLQLSNIPRP